MSICYMSSVLSFVRRVWQRKKTHVTEKVFEIQLSSKLLTFYNQWTDVTIFVSQAVVTMS